jgi:hypothetical protein
MSEKKLNLLSVVLQRSFSFFYCLVVEKVGYGSGSIRIFTRILFGHITIWTERYSDKSELGRGYSY